MNILKRTAALILLLLSAMGVVLCVTGVAAVWMVRQPLQEKTDRICGRIDGALTQAGDALQTLGQLLERAGGRLKDVHEAAPPPGSDTGKVQSFRSFAARTLVQEMLPGLGDVSPALQRLIATTTVANGVLSDLQDLPAGSLPFLDADQLRQMDEGVQKLATTTQDVASILGTPVGGADADANMLIARIEEALGRVIALVETYRAKVAEVQGKAQTIQRRLDSGIQWGAVVATVLLAWFVLAQMSLFAHAWSWLKRPSAK